MSQLGSDSSVALFAADTQKVINSLCLSRNLSEARGVIFSFSAINI